MSKIISRT
ncbi:hypothetical protein LINGRAHAP2_LOCUS19235 [Linum grandiflorum]